MVEKETRGLSFTYFRDELSGGEVSNEIRNLKIYFTTGANLTVRGGSSWFATEQMDKIVATDEELLNEIKKANFK